MIDLLRNRQKTESIALAYFFCEASSQNSQDVGNIFQTLLRQILSGNLHAFEAIEDKVKDGIPGLKTIKQIIDRATQSYDITYIVIDALDEFSSHHGARMGLVEALLDRLSSPDIKNLRLMITSRPQQDTFDLIRQRSTTASCFVDVTASDVNLNSMLRELYTEPESDVYASAQNLFRQAPELEDRILLEITLKSNNK